MRSFFYAYTNLISYKEGFLYLFRIIKKGFQVLEAFFIIYLLFMNYLFSEKCALNSLPVPFSWYRTLNQ